MNTLINIMAHKGAQQTFERHFDYWSKLVKRDEDMIVWCPSDDIVTCPGVQVQAIHRAQHIGSEANSRVWHIFNHIQHLGYEQYAFFEYDSICLGALPEFDEDIGANIFHDPEGYNSGAWLGKMFTHPPIVVKARALPHLIQAWTAVGINCERGTWDRALGLAIEKANLTQRNFLATKEGFACNTIHPAQFPDLIEAVKDGAKMIHGIKTEECLLAIKGAQAVQEAIDLCRANGYEVIHPDRE